MGQVRAVHSTEYEIATLIQGQGNSHWFSWSNQLSSMCDELSIVVRIEEPSPENNRIELLVSSSGNLRVINVLVSVWLFRKIAEQEN